MMKPMYLGDGVYVAQDARDGLRLWTSDGTRDTNVIYVDWDIWSALAKYVEEIEDERRVERSAEEKVQAHDEGEEGGEGRGDGDPSRDDPRASDT